MNTTFSIKIPSVEQPPLRKLKDCDYKIFSAPTFDIDLLNYKLTTIQF